MPMKNGTKWVSFSSLSELPRAAAALSRSASPSNDLQHVAESQAQVRHGGHFNIGAGDARYGDAEALVEVEFADGLAEDVASSHDHASEGDAALGEDEVFIAALTDDALELIEPRASADDGEAIVEMNHGRVGGGARFLAVADAGNSHARFDAPGDRVESYAIEIRIGDDKRMAFERLDLAAVLCREFRGLARRDRRGRFA